MRQKIKDFVYLWRQSTYVRQMVLSEKNINFMTYMGAFLYIKPVFKGRADTYLDMLLWSKPSAAPCNPSKTFLEGF